MVLFGFRNAPHQEKDEFAQIPPFVHCVIPARLVSSSACTNECEIFERNEHFFAYGISFV
jgi:hypothetical protein